MLYVEVGAGLPKAVAGCGAKRRAGPAWAPDLALFTLNLGVI